jgi:hypothetical protein
MMTGLFRKATLLSACGLLSASAVMAGVPSAGQSVIGAGIVLVATTGGVADVKGQKAIVVKDALGNPVQNSTVTIDFTTGTSQDMRLCSTQPFAGVGVSCGSHVVVSLTDATGTATFRVVGGAVNPGGGVPGAPAAGSGLGGALVKADGVTLGTLNVSGADENNAGGVGSVDLALAANDRFSITGPANYRERSDFNGDAAVNSVDLALIASIRFSGGSTISCASTCP